MRLCSLVIYLWFITFWYLGITKNYASLSSLIRSSREVIYLQIRFSLYISTLLLDARQRADLRFDVMRFLQTEGVFFVMKRNLTVLSFETYKQCSYNFWNEGVVILSGMYARERLPGTMILRKIAVWLQVSEKFYMN